MPFSRKWPPSLAQDTQYLTIFICPASKYKLQGDSEIVVIIWHQLNYNNSCVKIKYWADPNIFDLGQIIYIIISAWPGSIQISVLTNTAWSINHTNRPSSWESFSWWLFCNDSFTHYISRLPQGYPRKMTGHFQMTGYFQNDRLNLVSPTIILPWTTLTWFFCFDEILFLWVWK